MNLLGISINHRTAPVELREVLHFSEDEIRVFIQQIKESAFAEGIVISTCNRTEIYAIPKDDKTTLKELQNLIMNYKSALR